PWAAANPAPPPAGPGGGRGGGGCPWTRSRGGDRSPPKARRERRRSTSPGPRPGTSSRGHFAQGDGLAGGGAQRVVHAQEVGAGARAAALQQGPELQELPTLAHARD